MLRTRLLCAGDARRIAAAAEVEARCHGWAVTISVCDAGGHMLLLQRMDGAPLVSAQLAPEKARTCVLTGRASKTSEDMVNGGRFAALAMPIVPMEGGEVFLVDGVVIGGIGVSGVRADQDAQVARAGASALFAAAAMSVPAAAACAAEAAQVSV